MSTKPASVCISASRPQYCLQGKVPLTSSKAATSSESAPGLRSLRALWDPSVLNWSRVLCKRYRRPDMGFTAASKTAGAICKFCFTCVQTVTAAPDTGK